MVLHSSYKQKSAFRSPVPEGGELAAVFQGFPAFGGLQINQLEALGDAIQGFVYAFTGRETAHIGDDDPASLGSWDEIVHDGAGRFIAARGTVMDFDVHAAFPERSRPYNVLPLVVGDFLPIPRAANADTGYDTAESNEVSHDE